MMKQLGPYQLLRSLGEGGMGHVYLASLMKNGWFEKWLAIKTIKPELSKDTHFLKLFEKEAQMAAMLNHQHIVQIFDFGYSSENDAYLVMEYINGVDLREVLERIVLPIEITLEIMMACCKALDYASRFKNGDQIGLIHRDISPHNILLGFEGEIKLIDFGLIQFKGSSQNHIEGKIGYMSPEQARHEPLTFASDLFSLGIVFYECLTGTRVYHDLGRDLEEALQIQREAKITPIEKIKPNLDPSLIAMIHRLLAVNVHDRYQHANELYEDLKKLSKTLNLFISGNTQSWLTDLFSERFQDQVEKLKNAQQTLSSIQQVSTVSIVSKLIIQDVTESIVTPIVWQDTTSSVIPIQEEVLPQNQTLSSVIPFHDTHDTHDTSDFKRILVILFASLIVLGMGIGILNVFTKINSSDLVHIKPDQALPIIDQALPIIDQALPIIDQALPIIDQALPIIDQAFPIIDQAIPKVTQQPVLNTKIQPQKKIPIKSVIKQETYAKIQVNRQTHVIKLNEVLALRILDVDMKFRLEADQNHYDLVVKSNKVKYQFNHGTINEFPRRLKNLLAKNELIILKDSNLMVKLNIDLVW